MSPRFSGRSGFHSLRDLLSFIIGCAGLVYVVLQPDGSSNYPAITIFAGLIGAPYVLQRDERPRDQDSSMDESPQRTGSRPNNKSRRTTDRRN